MFMTAKKKKRDYKVEQTRFSPRGPMAPVKDQTPPPPSSKLTPVPKEPQPLEVIKNWFDVVTERIDKGEQVNFAELLARFKLYNVAGDGGKAGYTVMKEMNIINAKKDEIVTWGPDYETWKEKPQDLIREIHRKMLMHKARTKATVKPKKKKEPVAFAIEEVPVKATPAPVVTQMELTPVAPQPAEPTPPPPPAAKRGSKFSIELDGMEILFLRDLMNFIKRDSPNDTDVFFADILFKKLEVCR
jgi:hypothetical protein